MDNSILVTGHGMSVVDQIFDNVDMSYIIQYTRSELQDMHRYIRRLQPQLIIISLDSEDERFFKNIHEIFEEKEVCDIPVMIIGTSDECNKFAKRAGVVPSEKLIKPVSNNVIDEVIAELISADNQTKEVSLISKEDEEAIWKEKYEKYLKDIAEQVDINQYVSSEEDIVRTQIDDFEEDLPDPLLDGNNKSGKPVRKKAQGVLAEEDDFSVGSLEDEVVEKKHILIVDDDVMMLKMLRGYLEEFYDVAVAISGSVALKFLEEHRTDLIILDYKMPEMSGSEVVSRLRTSPKLKTIPVIFLTGASDAETVRECLKLKPQGYGLKPMPQDKLVEMVTGIIGL